jgi:hypothetical protein
LIILRDASEPDLEPHDDRLIVLDNISNPLAHWELGARGGRDFWITASEMKEKALEAKVLEVTQTQLAQLGVWGICFKLTVLLSINIGSRLKKYNSRYLSH